MSRLIINQPKGRALCNLLLAHGAGAGMYSDFLEQMAQALCDNHIAVHRFEFPYMQLRKQGVKRPPNTMQVLEQSFVNVLRGLKQHSDLPVFIAGKSMGGRVATHIADLEKVVGVIVFGYPFHSAGKPQQLRTEHLKSIEFPLLIIQGERDRLGNKEEVQSYGLERVQYEWMDLADHDLKPLKRSGATQAQYIVQAAESAARFIQQTLNQQ